MSKILNDNRIKQIFNLIKTNFFNKSEAREVSSIDVDTAPTEDSENLVTSGGVYEALSGKVAISQGSSHAGEFLIVGSVGDVTTMALEAWEGGSYGS